MKSSKSNSNNSQTKSFKNSLAKRDSSSSGRPTPLDFDSFIPWFCLELQVSRNIVVTRTNQAEYVCYNKKISQGSPSKSTRSKSRSTKVKLSCKSDNEDKRTSAVPIVSLTVIPTDAIPVTTCYNKRGQLVEIAIVGCSFEIPRKVIQALNLCLPFHSELSKLSIQKGGLCYTVLYEISKLLPYSNITEICLDDSPVPEGSYSVLLDRPSKIKYLSLKRCGIRDDECKKIAEKIDIKGPAMISLLLLDLTSNNITDEGAQALGEILKNNRYLTYLNLAGNSITDIGVSFLLRYLQEFPLTDNDITEKRGRYIDYLKSKSIIYEKCLREAKLARIGCNIRSGLNIIHRKSCVSTQIKPRKNKKHLAPSFTADTTTVEDEAEKKTIEIIGEFKDPFKEEYIKRKNDTVYAIGNLTLTYLNLAYNNLSLVSVRNILRTMKYQNGISTLTANTGLVRVVVDGNFIPTPCEELLEMDLFTKRAFSRNESSLNLSFINSLFR